MPYSFLMLFIVLGPPDCCSGFPWDMVVDGYNQVLLNVEIVDGLVNMSVSVSVFDEI